MALLQFGTTLVFGVPLLWNNENQPDPNLRKAQAVLGKMSFLTLLSSCTFFFSLIAVRPQFPWLSKLLYF